MPVDPGRQANVTKVNGFGLIVSNSPTTLGWLDETAAILGPECRIVLIGNTEQQLQYFATLIPKYTAICSDLISNGGQKWGAGK